MITLAFAISFIIFLQGTGYIALGMAGSDPKPGKDQISDDFTAFLAITGLGLLIIGVVGIISSWISLS